MEDLCCPRCKSTKYKNPNLKLMVNVCGHSLCEKCMEMLFVRGSGKCETCQIPLRRNNFRIQMFECPEVERDIDIRKKILKDYNKKERDFATLREYNDYLEEVETINVEETKLKIEQYKQANQDFIKKNRLKLSNEEEDLERLIELEEMERELAHQQILKDDENEKIQKQKLKENLLNDLIYSSLPASHILETHKKETEKNKVVSEKATKFSSGVLIGKQTDNPNSLPKLAPNPVIEYKYSPLIIDNMGPELPEYSKLSKLNYLANIREMQAPEIAGGFVSEVACFRALQDAYAGLFIFMDQPQTNS